MYAIVEVFIKILVYSYTIVLNECQNVKISQTKFYVGHIFQYFLNYHNPK